MNMPFIPPFSLISQQLVLSYEHYTQGNLVYLSLQRPINSTQEEVYVTCVVEAHEKSDSFFLESAIDPQEGLDIPFDYLEVDTSLLVKVYECFSGTFKENEEFTLSWVQADQLNGWLKEDAIEKAKLNHFGYCEAA